LHDGIVEKGMADISERHEIRVQGDHDTFVFLADSADGRLVIRQEPEGNSAKEVCAITLANPEELRVFFEGFRRVLASMGHAADIGGASPASRTPAGPLALDPPGSRGQPAGAMNRDVDREALIEKARERNPQAFTAWTPDEEAEVRRRFESGQKVAEIARAHKRSPRAIELRLQRMGLLAATPAASRAR
jgi:hypothetical protein